jgi:hypothetical protein
MADEQKQIAEKLFDLFGGLPYWAEGKTNQSGAYYVTVENAFTYTDIYEHLAGKRTVGAYQLDPDNMVKWILWDIDAEGDIQASRDMTKQILDRIDGLDYVVEYSGWKGYHIWLFLTEPMKAETAKTIAEAVRDELGLSRSTHKKQPHVECYPKQGSLKDKGSLIKMPLGQHPKSHNWSRFIDPEKGWEDGPDMDPMTMLNLKVSHEELLTLIDTKIEDPWAAIVEALAVEWVSTKRHNLALFLAGYLAILGWSFENATKIVEEICDKAGDPEVSNRLDTVESTFKKFHSGESVAGLNRLGELLSGAAMRVLTAEASKLAVPDKARQIDAVRLSKGPLFKKQQLIVNIIWSHLVDADIGRPIRVSHSGGRDYDTYWYDAETHIVYRMGTNQWSNFIYSLFGLNVDENFSRVILSGVRRKVEEQGFQHAQVYRASAWVDNVLYVSLGGPKIWVCDGKKKPYEVFNGSIPNIFFWNDKMESFAEPIFDSPVDAWDHLVNDLNFTRSKSSPLSDEQQTELLKAWILCQFFREDMPTRPLLALLGASGSGKTTCARRILKIFEGVDEDVIPTQEDKPDFLRVAIEQHRILVLDNLEQTQVRWLPNKLDVLATGGTIVIKKLYETNTPYTIKSDVFVILTAVTMPFSKETTFNRMLVLEMEKLTTYLPEHFFKKQLLEYLPAIWGSMLQKLNQVVAVLNVTPDIDLAKITNRLADYAYFCYRIRQCPAVEGHTLISGLERMQVSQQYAQATSDHSLFPLIQEFVETQPHIAAKPTTAGGLLKTLKEMAEERRMRMRWMPNTPVALAHHLRSLQELLRQELGMTIEEEYNSKKGRTMVLYSFPDASQFAEMREQLREMASKNIEEGEGSTAGNGGQPKGLPNLEIPPGEGEIRTRINLRRIVQDEEEE